MFTTFRYDVDCSPLPELSHLYTAEEASEYANMTTYDILMTELDATNMVQQKSTGSSSSQKEGIEGDAKDLYREIKDSPRKGQELL
jgi:hypothetical protein